MTEGGACATAAERDRSMTLPGFNTLEFESHSGIPRRIETVNVEPFTQSRNSLTSVFGQTDNGGQ